MNFSSLYHVGTRRGDFGMRLVIEASRRSFFGGALLMKKVVLSAIAIAAFALTGCQKDEGGGAAPQTAATPQATTCTNGMPAQYCNNVNGQYYPQPYYGNGTVNPYDYYGAYGSIPYYGCGYGSMMMNVAPYGSPVPRYACVPSYGFRSYHLYFQWGFNWGANYNNWSSGYGPAQSCNSADPNSCGPNAICRAVGGWGSAGVCCHGYSGWGS
jgi:hypothetical protein